MIAQTCIAVECNPENDYSYKKQWSFTFNDLFITRWM